MHSYYSPPPAEADPPSASTHPPTTPESFTSLLTSTSLDDIPDLTTDIPDHHLYHHSIPFGSIASFLDLAPPPFDLDLFDFTCILASSSPSTPPPLAAPNMIPSYYSSPTSPYPTPLQSPTTHHHHHHALGFDYLSPDMALVPSTTRDGYFPDILYCCGDHQQPTDLTVPFTDFTTTTTDHVSPTLLSPPLTPLISTSNDKPHQQLPSSPTPTTVSTVSTVSTLPLVATGPKRVPTVLQKVPIPQPKPKPTPKKPTKKKPHPHPCPHPSCPRTFARKFNLTIHLQTHNPHRTKSFHCTLPTCTKSFHRMPDLVRHRRVVHKVAD